VKLVLINRERLQSLGSFLVSEFDSLISRIRGSWGVEHNDDDSHGNVHADSVATGRLTFSDIVTSAVTTAQIDNHNPGGLSTAALLRISSPTPQGHVTWTGLQVPQDDGGTVLDGRALVIENTSVSTVFRLVNESTSSLPRNRFNLPWSPINPAGDEWFLLYPGMLAVVVYNASKARWQVASQNNDTIRTAASFSTSQNDYAPAGLRTSRYVSLLPAVAGLSISGFDARVSTDSTAVPAPTTKILTNDGLFTVDLLHMNASSLLTSRIQCPGGVRYRLYPRESVTIYRSDENTWKIVEKADQWYDSVYAAGSFTTDAGTWTVDAGDVTTLTWQLDGNKMTCTFHLTATTVATNPTELRIAIPGLDGVFLTRTIARTTANPILAKDNGTVVSTAYVEALVGKSYLRVRKDQAGTAWVAATNATEIRGQITFMVQDSNIAENHNDVAHGDVTHADVEHSDVAHVDVAHGDSHTDASHSDVAHSDVAHSDVAHTDTHGDVAHSDSHDDTAHSDVAHGDTAHDDSHGDVLHGDNHADHTSGTHADSHSDTPHDDSHGDTAHDDVAHSDGSHTDAHGDTAHTDTHSDVAHVDAAHSDVAHVDAGHTDSHSDTAPHSDTAHVDVAHADTPHSDSLHQDLGYHVDGNHVDI
jgi:hypothetical protein